MTWETVQKLHQLSCEISSAANELRDNRRPFELQVTKGFQANHQTAKVLHRPKFGSMLSVYYNLKPIFVDFGHPFECYDNTILTKAIAELRKVVAWLQQNLTWQAPSGQKVRQVVFKPTIYPGYVSPKPQCHTHFNWWHAFIVGSPNLK